MGEEPLGGAHPAGSMLINPARGIVDSLLLLLPVMSQSNFRAVYNRWTGLLEWTSELDYWTHRLHLKRTGQVTIHD